MNAGLDVEHLAASYGTVPVLFDVSLHIEPGETLALVGRNGMGKTTTIRTILGLLRASAGTIRFGGADLVGSPAFRIARLGIGLVPEGRGIFPTLSVRENLMATAANWGKLMAPWTLDEVCALFPRLRERLAQRGDQLSGGEAQMLAIARALLLNPRLLILDEATEGLAPVIRDEIWAALARVRDRGQSVLVVDKHLAVLARLADRAVVLEKGRAVWSGAAADLVTDASVAERYLTV